MNTVTRHLWSKKTKERHNVDFILIAEIPDQSKPIYVSTIGGSIEQKFKHNFKDKLQEITISEKKSDKSRLLKLKFTEDKYLELPKEEFVLLICCINTDDLGKTNMDNLLYFRIPKPTTSLEIKQCYFPDDKKEQAAIALFQLSANFIGDDD